MSKISAQHTSLTSYPINTPFYAGIENAIELYVVNPADTLLNNFEVVDNHLVFTGEDNSEVLLKAKVAISTQKPSAVDPTAPLDFGAKAVLRVYLQVGSKKGAPVRLDETYYYPAFEYPFINYTLDLEDIFRIDCGEVVKVYAYWELQIPLSIPVTPSNPNPALTFYVTIQRANVSIIAFSTGKYDTNQVNNNTVIPVVSPTLSKVIPLGPNLNNELYRFKANVNGKTLIRVRMNIGDTTLYNDANQQTTIVINTNWFIYLSLNGSNDRNNLSFQTITNTPNISNGNTVWPATMELYLLAQLKSTDEITVKADLVDALAPSLNPPYFLPVTSGHVNTFLTFETISTNSLYPCAETFAEYNSMLTLGLNGDLNSAVEFPVGDIVKFSKDFKKIGPSLVYVGNNKQKFIIHGALNISRLIMNVPEAKTAPVITLQGFGFAIGVNGVKQNEVSTTTNMYADLRYNLKWLAEETAENIVELKKGDIVSFLVWSNNAKYMDQVPNPSIVIPNITPGPNATSDLTGHLSFVISAI